MDGKTTNFKYETPTLDVTDSDMFKMAIAFGKPEAADINISVGARAELKELKDKYGELIATIDSVDDSRGFMSVMAQLNPDGNPLEESKFRALSTFDPIKLEALLVDRYAYLLPSDRETVRAFCRSKVEGPRGTAPSPATQGDAWIASLSRRIERLEAWVATIGGFPVLLASQGENTQALARRLDITDPDRIITMELAAMFGHDKNIVGNGPLLPRIKTENLVQLAEESGITSEYSIYRMEEAALYRAQNKMVWGKSAQEVATEIGITTPRHLCHLEDYACALSGMNVDSIMDARRKKTGELNLYAAPRQNMHAQAVADNEYEDSDEEGTPSNLENSHRMHLEYLALIPADQAVKSGMSIGDAIRIHGIKNPSCIQDLNNGVVIQRDSRRLD